MGEYRFEMKPYGVRYKCECGGEMLPTGTMLLVDPPKYPHKCEECEQSINLSEKYPAIRWEKVD